MKKTIVSTNTFLAAFLVSVIIGGHAYASGGGSGTGHHPSHVYMNVKAAKTSNCDYQGFESAMHRYRCGEDADGNTEIFWLESPGVETAEGYKMCRFIGSNWVTGFLKNNWHHQLRAENHPNNCAVDQNSSDNTFFAITHLVPATK